MKSLMLVMLAAGSVNCFPAVMNSLMQRDFAQPGCSTSALCNKEIHISNAQAHIPATPNAATKASQARTNCGQIGVCDTFDAEKQYVSTSGKHAYQSPSASDIRGPCPGLNAAANHGYLPRNGIANTEQTITGLGAVYGMSVDLAAFLAAYSIAFDGDAISGTWSIGGPLPSNLVTGLLGVPQGDGYSHNNYEGDTSITRCDAFTNGGDAHSSSMTRFKYAYEIGMAADQWTLDDFARVFTKNTHRSVMTNSRYFAPLFSTTLVAPAAYNFLPTLMSNRTAENTAGYFDSYIFKTFFAVGGEYPNFYWKKGEERIPENWYKRPNNDYSIPSVFGDLIPEFLAYPDSFRFGGNVNGVNSYTGIDIANFTNGAYNVDTLFEGDNFACFFFENEQQAIPLQLQGGLNDVATAYQLIASNFGPFLTSLSCPQLGKYAPGMFTQYTGSSYTPSAPKSGPRNC